MTQISVTADIDDDRTRISVTGSRRVAIAVESASGERIYLPPEQAGDATDRSDDETPYEGMDAGPYEGTTGGADEGIRADSPYEGMSEDSSYGSVSETQPGVTPTDSGFRVVHPEPATDLRVLR